MRLVPKYTAPESRAALEARLRRPHMQLVDRTSVVPLRPNASHRELPAVLSDLMLECEAYPHRIILLLRNGFNTPAFLGGLWTWFVHEHAVRSARCASVEPRNPTPGLIAVHAQGFNVIPTHVLVCELPIAVGMASMLLNENPYEFLCCVCSKPLSTPPPTGPDWRHAAPRAADAARRAAATRTTCRACATTLSARQRAACGCAAPLPLPTWCQSAALPTSTKCAARGWTRWRSCERCAVRGGAR